MTTEDDFRRALLDRQDWHSRLVFADWLEERNDPRADGYRALGMLHLSPAGGPWWAWWYNAGSYSAADRASNPQAFLPADWFARVRLEPNGNECKPTIRSPDCKDQARVEDAAALAFAELPAERRAQLLALAEVTR